MLPPAVPGRRHHEVAALAVLRGAGRGRGHAGLGVRRQVFGWVASPSSFYSSCLPSWLLLAIQCRCPPRGLPPPACFSPPTYPPTHPCRVQGLIPGCAPARPGWGHPPAAAAAAAAVPPLLALALQRTCVSHPGGSALPSRAPPRPTFAQPPLCWPQYEPLEIANLVFACLMVAALLAVSGLLAWRVWRGARERAHCGGAKAVQCHGPPAELVPLPCCTCRHRACFGPAPPPACAPSLSPWLPRTAARPPAVNRAGKVWALRRKRTVQLHTVELFLQLVNAGAYL